MQKWGFILGLVPLAVAVWFLSSLRQRDGGNQICRYDHLGHSQRCRPICKHGQFSLPGMNSCHPWLGCLDIEGKVKLLELLGSGAVKAVYKAAWKGHKVVYNRLQTPQYKADFRRGLAMLAKLQPHSHVTQLLGYCKDAFLTEYHDLGTAVDILDLLQGPLAREDSVATRLNLCINYVKVISFLHNSPIGTRVMCDSNDLKKTLSQFLITSDLNFVVNDLDALPEVTDDQGVKCGHRQLHGDFVAPEQKWPYIDKPFSDELMPGYDEKTDIWKIPDVCDYFLGNIEGSDSVRFYLFKIHKQCKTDAPSKRPDAKEILNSYMEVKRSFEQDL